MNLKKIRKALTAGLSAGVGAAVTYQVGLGWSATPEAIGGTAGAFAAAAVPAAWLTWRVPNAKVRQTPAIDS
jgi:hypothetical protein